MLFDGIVYCHLVLYFEMIYDCADKDYIGLHREVDPICMALKFGMPFANNAAISHHEGMGLHRFS